MSPRHPELHVVRPPSTDASTDAKDMKSLKKQLLGAFISFMTLSSVGFSGWVAYQFWDHGNRLTVLEVKVNSIDTKLDILVNRKP